MGDILSIFNCWIIFLYTKLLYQYYFTETQFFSKSHDRVL